MRFHDRYVATWHAAEHGEADRLPKVEPDLRDAAERAHAVVPPQAHREHLGGALDGIRTFDTRGVLEGEMVEFL
ncbi:hypothetical protein [Blastococcus sp. SYSU DS0533]